MRDHLFRVDLEHSVPGSGWYTLARIRHGPFATPDDLEADLVARLRAWDQHARSLGGWAWRSWSRCRPTWRWSAARRWGRG